MRYAVLHTTTLTYASPVALARFSLRLRPCDWPGQQIDGYRLTLDPVPQTRTELTGPFAVNTCQIGYDRPLRQVTISSRFTAEIAPPRAPVTNPHLAAVREAALAVHDLSPSGTAPYMFPSRIAVSDGDIAHWAKPLMPGEGGIIDVAGAVMQAIHREFAYQPGATTSRTTPSEAFHLRKGVCQDFAHIMILALRSHGIPAAYASGYLRTLPPPGQPRLVGADAMHAWVNVWCGPDNGWIGFDPTNNRLVDDAHILIAMGRDYADVAPIDGTFVGNAPQSQRLSVDVAPLE